MSQTAENLAPTSRAKAPRDLRKYVPFLVLVIVCVAFSLVSDQFFSSRNLETVLRQTAVLSIAAMGGTFIIMMASIDLSVGSVVGLAAVVTAYFVGDYGYAAILMGVTVGAICGRGRRQRLRQAEGSLLHRYAWPDGCRPRHDAAHHRGAPHHDQGRQPAGDRIGQCRRHTDHRADRLCRLCDRLRHPEVHQPRPQHHRHRRRRNRRPAFRHPGRPHQDHRLHPRRHLLGYRRYCAGYANGRRAARPPVRASNST